jgi:hypothetical protein
MKRVFVSYSDRQEHPLSVLGDQTASLATEVVTRDSLPMTLDPEETRLRIREQLQKSEVTIVLIDETTEDSAAVAREVDWTLAAGGGLVGIKLREDLPTPERLFYAGAEILDWTRQEDVEYLREAVNTAALGARILAKATSRGTGTGAQCQRRMP